MGKRILIVEDSTMMRRVIAKVLREGGHEIVGEASSGTGPTTQRVADWPPPRRARTSVSACGRALDLDLAGGSADP